MSTLTVFCMAAAITWVPCSKTCYVKKQPNKIKIGKFYQKLADFSLCNYFFALSASSISLLKLSGFSISLGNSWSIIWLANCSFWGVFCWPTASDAVFSAVLICSFSKLHHHCFDLKGHLYSNTAWDHPTIISTGKRHLFKQFYVSIIKLLWVWRRFVCFIHIGLPSLSNSLIFVKNYINWVKRFNIFFFRN